MSTFYKNRHRGGRSCHVRVGVCVYGKPLFLQSVLLLPVFAFHSTASGKDSSLLFTPTICSLSRHFCLVLFVVLSAGSVFLCSLRRDLTDCFDHFTDTHINIYETAERSFRGLFHFSLIHHPVSLLNDNWQVVILFCFVFFFHLHIFL